MMSFRLVKLLAAAGIVLSAPALAADRQDAEILAGFARTGEYENCLRVQQIESSRILNRHQILFEMKGSKTYLSEPDSCPGLSKSLALAYDATTGELCTTTIVHLIDAGSAAGGRGTCALSKFQRLSKKPPG